MTYDRKGVLGDFYLATRFPWSYYTWDVEVNREAARSEKQYAENAYSPAMGRLFLLSLACLCAESYWVGHMSGPYGVRGLVLFTSILIAGWSIGVLTGFFGALAAKGG